jgi:hypothetical protein
MAPSLSPASCGRALVPVERVDPGERAERPWAAAVPDLAALVGGVPGGAAAIGLAALAPVDDDLHVRVPGVVLGHPVKQLTLELAWYHAVDHP